VRFFVGEDEDAAKEIEKVTTQRELQIQDLNQAIQ